VSYTASLAATRRLFERAVVGNRWAWCSVVLAIVAVGALLQISLPVNHDVAWLLVATGKLLDGANVYATDVVEFNPPLILYLYAPSVGLARLLGLPEIALFRCSVGLLGLASLILCDRALVAAFAGRRATLRRALLAVLAYLFFVFVDRDFGQREHFMTMLALPYLLVAAARRRRLPVPLAVATLAGIGCGLAMSLKPNHLVVVAAVELALMVRLRSASSFIRPEICATGVVGLVYLGSLFVLTPGVFEVVAPLAVDAYWIFWKPVGWIVRRRELVLIAVALASALALRRDETLADLAVVLFVAAVGFYVAMLIQGTGWVYHRIPFYGAAIPVIAMAAFGFASRLGSGQKEETGLGLRAAGAGAAGLLTVALLCAQPGLARNIDAGRPWRTGETTGVVKQLKTLIDEEAAGGSVYFLTPALVVPFPAVVYSNAAWASRFSCLWLLPAVVRARAGARAAPSWLTPERIDALETYLFDSVIADLERHRPELIFFELRRKLVMYGAVRIDVLKFFRKNPRFEAIWSEYTPLPQTVGPFGVAIRKPDAPRR